VVIGSKALIDHIFRTEFLPIGHVPDPFQAWLIQRGMRTLAVRMPYHYQSALQVCDFLYDHPAVEQVFYPMHPKSPSYALASSQMKGGSGLLSLRLKCTDRSKIESAIDSLKMFRIGVSWGGYESLVFPPLATKDGDPSVLRLHIGLEETQSLLGDLGQAFARL
jgi:cystathionine beta-lyase/cystathionine gamma-synthase